MADAGDKSWSLDAIRVTLFPLIRSSSVQWEHLTGSLPETRSERPAEGVQEASGSFLERTLTLRTAPGVAHFTLVLDPPGEYSVSAAFMEHVFKWFHEYPMPINRMAYAPVLSCLVGDLVEGRKLILARVPSLDFDPAAASDVMFQINWPKPSETQPDLVINRLSKWATIRTEGIFIASGLKVPDFIRFSARMELDINTAPILGELNEPAAIMRELMAAGDRIVAGGERA